MSLIIQDFGGKNNADLAETRARLLSGSSWKKTRIVVIIPAGERIQSIVALSHWNLAFPPNQGVVRLLTHNVEVGEAYSAAISDILSHPEFSQWEYILTLEHDNLPPQLGVLQLVEAMEAHPEYACIGGLYFTRGEGGVAQIWGDPADPIPNFRPQPPDLGGGLIECCGTGMGFNLWRLSMFKDPQLRRPWFKTLPNTSQDLYFWSDARKYGYRCAVHCGVKVGHIDEKGFIW